MDNEIMKTGTTEIATDAPMDFFDGRTGFEDLDPSCIKVPYLKLAKDGTDECKKQSAVYIPGLEPGMFFCPTTKKIYGTKIRISALHFQRTYVIYEGIGKESKFKGTMSSVEFDQKIKPIGVREKSYVLANGLRYVDTRNFLVAPYDSLEDGRMVFSLYSTGIKPSELLLTQATNVRVQRNGKTEVAPMWSSVWELESRFFNDPKGDYFQVSRVDRIGWVAKGEASAQLKKWFDDAKDMALSVVEDEVPAQDAPFGRDVTPEHTPSAMASAAAGKSAPKAEPKPQDIF